jgi:hypothetical protein
VSKKYKEKCRLRVLSKDIVAESKDSMSSDCIAHSPYTLQTYAEIDIPIDGDAMSRDSRVGIPISASMGSSVSTSIPRPAPLPLGGGAGGRLGPAFAAAVGGGGGGTVAEDVVVVVVLNDDGAVDGAGAAAGAALAGAGVGALCLAAEDSLIFSGMGVRGICDCEHVRLSQSEHRTSILPVLDLRRPSVGG